MISHAVQHYYRKYRRHQLDTYGDSGLTQGGRSVRQFTGGSAAYGFHAVAAYNSARSMIHFRKQLKRSIR